MAAKQESERGLEGSDTTPPPAGPDEDAFDAPTRVGSLPAALAELMRDYDSVDASEPVADEGGVVREPDDAPPVGTEPIREPAPEPAPEPAKALAARARAPVSPPPTEQRLERRRETAGMSGTVRLFLALGTLLVLSLALYFRRR
jgi:hypothetical protein